MFEKTLLVQVEGVVQGVFFRKFVKENALAFGVKGFVRNLDDGRVEAVCQGNENSLKKLLEKINVGPPSARVKKVVSNELKLAEKFEHFEIWH